MRQIIRIGGNSRVGSHRRRQRHGGSFSSFAAFRFFRRRRRRLCRLFVRRSFCFALRVLVVVILFRLPSLSFGFGLLNDDSFELDSAVFELTLAFVSPVEFFELSALLQSGVDGSQHAPVIRTESHSRRTTATRKNAGLIS